MPPDAAIAAEFINIPLDLTDDTSDTYIIAGDTPKESARPCKNRPLKSKVIAYSRWGTK